MTQKCTITWPKPCAVSTDDGVLMVFGRDMMCLCCCVQMSENNLIVKKKEQESRAQLERANRRVVGK